MSALNDNECQQHVSLLIIGVDFCPWLITIIELYQLELLQWKSFMTERSQLLLKQWVEALFTVRYQVDKVVCHAKVWSEFELHQDDQESSFFAYHRLMFQIRQSEQSLMNCILSKKSIEGYNFNSENYHNNIEDEASLCKLYTRSGWAGNKIIRNKWLR